MEILLHLLFACLKCWRVLFSLLGTACTLWFVASLRMMRRADRVEGRFGVTLPDQVLDALPMASSVAELVLIGGAAACCWVVVWAVRGLERQY